MEVLLIIYISTYHNVVQIMQIVLAQMKDANH